MATMISSERPRAIWVVLAMTPVAVGWAVALVSQPSVMLGYVFWFGVLALTSGLALGTAIWWRAMSHDRMDGVAIAELTLAVTLSTVLWIWVQYALNPLRMRPVIDAMIASRSVSWQVVAGLFLFAGIAIVARLSRDLPPKGSDSSVEVRAVESVRTLQHLTVRLGRRTLLIDLDRVERLQGCDDYVAVFADGRRLLASYRLSELAGRLDPERFVRIHRSHIVSVAHISSVERIDTNRDAVCLKSGERLQASRRGTVTLRERLRSSS